MDRTRSVYTTLVGILVAASFSTSTFAADGLLKWQTDYAVAQKKRASEHKPLLVFVTMDGCHFCHKMLAETYSDHGVAATIKSKFLPTKIDGTRQQALAQRFGVRIFPTTFFINADNRVVDRVEGYMSPDMFRERVAVVSSTVR